MIYKEINYSELPYNCIAAAAERMRRDFAKEGKCNPLDVRIVLGDPCEGVSMSESFEERFRKRIAKR